MSDLLAHFKKGTFEEQYWIPAHNKRRESNEFKKNKKFVRDECGAPCWICGKSKDLEVHHVFEWSFWNVLDPKKVTKILKAIEFYDEKYISKAKLDSAKLRAKIEYLENNELIVDSPDDIRNLVVLCREHHRLKYSGVHTISFPIWLAIAGVPSEGGLLSKEQILLAAERIKKIDEELAALAENNYEPHRL